MTQQLNAWKSEFGDAYTDRNLGEPERRITAFTKMLEGLDIQKILEVGCNRGNNLVALRLALGEPAQLEGIEPNRHAAEVARQNESRATIHDGDCFALPFEDHSFDLLFTCGVLIHVALADLPRAMKEIFRVSSRYLLAVEYCAEEETVIAYRGHNDLLWKRDFLKHYLTLFPRLKLIRQGFWGPQDGFDDCGWWLMEKADHESE